MHAIYGGEWWLEEKECVALVEREWGSMEAYGWGAFVLKEKIKRNEEKKN